MFDGRRGRHDDAADTLEHILFETIIPAQNEMSGQRYPPIIAKGLRSWIAQIAHAGRPRPRLRPARSLKCGDIQLLVCLEAWFFPCDLDEFREHLNEKRFILVDRATPG